MDDDKRQLVRKCIDLIGQAEDALECPVCFDNKSDVVQCVIGHHVCRECRTLLKFCPICQNNFSGTKSFLIQELSHNLTSVKLSLSDLEEKVKKSIQDNSVENVRKLLKTVLFDFSSYCYKNNSFLLFLAKYLQSPAEHHREMEQRLLSLTSELRKLTRTVNDTEIALASLKR